MSLKNAGDLQTLWPLDAGPATMPSKDLSKRPVDVVIVAFLLIHALVTALIDSQAVLPKSFYPQPLLKLNAWYLSEFHDPLLLTMPNWFKFMVYLETFVQLPFFLVAAYAYWKGLLWIRPFVIYYGFFVFSTTLPMLAEFAMSSDKKVAKISLIAFYLPFAGMPLLMAQRMLNTLAKGHRAFPFRPGGRGRKSL